MVKQGLRERSKARRSEAVIRAAFELFAEQGYDATTVAEIAERAEVSPRTVAMYFRSKQDIAMSKFSEGADRLTEAMRNRSPDERAVDVLGRWLLAEHESGDDEMVELERRMFVANPELAALRTARMDAAIRESTRVVAEDLGVAPETVGPRMVAVAATAIIIELFTGTQESDLEQAAVVALRLIEAAIESLPRDAG
ncbi:TetR/AcrR family transcriptional regulator [Streptomyces sp. NPDC049541]|uniref:TetR/AcrR family transcriptional regulator n=1 Tax=Streptomyces sp. NPDC049541 TaxID=3365594 RepID=UPI000C1AC858